MEQARTKTDLIDRLQRERAFWEALLRVVSEADMLLPGVVGDWTFKDVVAHLTGWRKRTIARIANPGQGRDPRPAEWPVDLDDLDDLDDRSKDPDAINAWICRANRDRTLADVLAESRQVWQQLLEVVEAAPEEELLEPGRFPWLEGQPLGPAVLNGSLAHLHEHAAQINDWLAGLYYAA